MASLDWKILSDGAATNFLSRLSKRRWMLKTTRFCCRSKTQNEGGKPGGAGRPRGGGNEERWKRTPVSQAGGRGRRQTGAVGGTANVPRSRGPVWAAGRWAGKAPAMTHSAGVSAGATLEQVQ